MTIVRRNSVYDYVLEYGIPLNITTVYSSSYILYQEEQRIF